MKKSNIVWGILLIAIAVILVANGLGVLPDLPWIQTILSAGLLVFSGRQIWRKHFFWSMISLGCVAWIWEEHLGIEAIAPFPLLLAAALLGIGLNMIFGRKITIEKYNGNNGCNISVSAEEARTENWEDGRHVVLTNIFNSTSKYVNSEAFDTATFENVFGSANVYFNNAIIANGTASVSVENVFGTLNLYFPSTWRVQVNEDSVFGGVRIYGKACTAPDVPVIRMDVESVFGNVNIYFE
ncbi:MAG: LiaF domain-containing protein [Agathobacter sp.]